MLQADAHTKPIKVLLDRQLGTLFRFVMPVVDSYGRWFEVADVQFIVGGSAREQVEGLI